MSYNSKYKGAEVEAKLEKIDSLNAGMEDTDETVDDVAEFPYVSYEAQEATEEQKEQARKNIGAYSKPSGGIPKTDLASDVQTSLGKADTALQSYTEQYKGTITGINMNGASKGTSGVVDLGTVITAHQDISGKLDKTTADSTYAKKISTGSVSAASATINPNYLYVWGTMSSLSIALATPADSTIYNEYMFQFTSGSTPTSLSVPSTVKWVVEPNIEANKTYQVSIVNNIGIIAGV